MPALSEKNLMRTAVCLTCAQVQSLQSMVRDQQVALDSTSYALQTAEVRTQQDEVLPTHPALAAENSNFEAVG